MMVRAPTLLVSLGLIASGAAGQGQAESRTSQVDNAAARQALATLGRLVNKDNFRQFGFENLRDARTATLGVPISEYMIRLDELQNYQPGQDPTPLLHATDRVMFVVQVNGQTRSSVTLGRTPQGWEAVAFGSPQRARAVDSTRAALSARDAIASADYFEVRVPALNATFLGARRAGRLFLTPVQAEARFGFAPGRTLPAEEALQAMVVAARAHNGLPT